MTRESLRSQRGPAYVDVIHEPPGPFAFAVDEAGALLWLQFLDGDYPRTIEEEIANLGYQPGTDPAKTAQARRELLEYCRGERLTFTLPLKMHGTVLAGNGLASAHRHSVRGNAHLRPGGCQPGPARSGASHGTSECHESDLHRRSLSPRCRRNGSAHRVWRRAPSQAPLAGARGIGAGNHREGLRQRRSLVNEVRPDPAPDPRR